MTQGLWVESKIVQLARNALENLFQLAIWDGEINPVRWETYEVLSASLILRDMYVREGARTFPPERLFEIMGKLHGSSNH